MLNVKRLHRLRLRAAVAIVGVHIELRKLSEIAFDVHQQGNHR